MHAHVGGFGFFGPLNVSACCLYPEDTYLANSMCFEVSYICICPDV